MRAFLGRVKRLAVKEASPPPPYEENALEPSPEPEERNSSFDPSNSQTVDLLASCSISEAQRNESETDDPPEPVASEVMGLKYSTPWGSRHRSKISLTWVLREQSDVIKHSSREKRLFYEDFRVKSDSGASNLKTIDSSRQWTRDAVNRIGREATRVGDREERVRSSRIVGRNEFYNGLMVREEGRAVDTSSEGTSAAGSASGRGRRRRRRRRKREGFGYEISNIDGFLAEASIERPGNIPVVLSRASTLYETRAGVQRETPLPLGTVVNAVFKKSAWLYVQTAHAHEGYVQHSACLPLGILPTDSSSCPRRRTPCWESSSDLYPRPCGNMTDAEKRGELRARSECGRRAGAARSLRGEEAFDRLYLRAVSRAGGVCEGWSPQKRVDGCCTTASQHTLPASGDDCCGVPAAGRRGEVAVLARGAPGECADWLRVRTRAVEGFIPAEIAGNGYI